MLRLRTSRIFLSNCSQAVGVTENGLECFSKSMFSQKEQSSSKKFRLHHVGRKKSLLKAGLEVDAVEGSAAHRPIDVLLEETSVGLKQKGKKLSLCKTCCRRRCRDSNPCQPPTEFSKEKVTVKL